MLNRDGSVGQLSLTGKKKNPKKLILTMSLPFLEHTSFEKTAISYFTTDDREGLGNSTLNGTSLG
jgi:hypothetical protein